MSEKKKAYINKINKKLYWLDKFARNKDKLLYSYKSQDEKKNEEIEEQKKKLQTKKRIIHKETIILRVV